MNADYRFAVIGGDLRQVFLADLLVKDGFEVTMYAQETADYPVTGTPACDTLQKAFAGRNVVLLPVPMCNKNGIVQTPLSTVSLDAQVVCNEIPEGTTVFGGNISSTFRVQLEKARCSCIDYLEREEFAVRNAAATAEAALVSAANALLFTLSGSRCLVCGYGRIGKILAKLLHRLGADVTVSARKQSDFAWIEAEGYRVMEHSNLCLRGFDVIFNTVPHLILTRERLEQATQAALVLDLASLPGGVDLEAAAALGIPVQRALSLPGKYAPMSAARYLQQTIYSEILQR